MQCVWNIHDMPYKRRIQTKVNTEMIKISNKPNTRDELKNIMQDRISKEGPNCDLNDIDVNQITDMSYLFYGLDFTGNISSWDVSNVTTMKGMFIGSNFTGNISNWNVSNVKYIKEMFDGCTSLKNKPSWYKE